MTSANTTNAAAILKTQYTQAKVYWLAYKNNHSIAEARKDESFGGDYKMVAIQTEVPQGGGVTIALAQQHLNPSVYKRFQLTRKNDFTVARVTGEAMKAADGNEDALIMLWTREMDGAIHNSKRSAAIHFFRNGTGSRGQISSGSNVSNAQVTLTRTSDVTNFAIGMTLQAAATDGGTLRNAGANIVLTGIDRVNGILTAAAAWTGSIAAVAANDFLLREGDNNGVFQGRAAWVPGANVTNTLFNSLDRTPDPVRLAGQWFDATGMTFREVIIEGCARVEVEGGEPDTVRIHPRDKATLVKELEGKSIYTKETTVGIKGSDGTVGFDVIEAEFDGHKLQIKSDINCPRGDMYIEQTDVWGFNTLGPFPHIIDYDTNDFLRVYNDDSFEVRIATRGDFECLSPGYVCHPVNVGK